MRWVFIRPCNKSPYYDPEILEPLGLEYLAASRREKGDQVLVLDSALESLNDTKLARRAASFRPDVIGFSVMTAQQIDSVNAIHAECLHSLAGRPVRWLAGGNFISTEPIPARSLFPAEFLLVRFEGENALDSLGGSWASGTLNRTGDVDSLPPDRTYTGTSVEALDTLPFPERPFAQQIQGSGWAFNLQSSRGCCGTCRYCSSPGMTGDSKNSRWRGRSSANIVEEMASLHRQFGARSFNFIDEDFLGPNHLSHRRAQEFSEALRRRKLQVSFGIQVRPGSLSEEIIDLLAEAGLTYVFMGIESDDPRDFKRWGRPWTPDPWRLIIHLRRRGVEVNAGVLLFHSHSTFQGIRRFAQTLYKHGLLDYRSATNRLDAMPGSLFYMKAMEDNELNPSITGPQPLPYVHPEMELFHRDVLVAVDPLGPPSMHAICSLPPLLARRKLDNRIESAYRELRRIISLLDETVARTFFSVLDHHEKGIGQGNLISELRRQNLENAITSARDLVSHGFAPSFDVLREAIRIDSGL